MTGIDWLALSLGVALAWIVGSILLAVIVGRIIRLRDTRDIAAPSRPAYDRAEPSRRLSVIRQRV